MQGNCATEADLRTGTFVGVDGEKAVPGGSLFVYLEELSHMSVEVKRCPTGKV